MLDCWLNEFLRAVARTVLSATMKYAAPATANKCIISLAEKKIGNDHGSLDGN